MGQTVGTMQQAVGEGLASLASGFTPTLRLPELPLPNRGVNELYHREDATKQVMGYIENVVGGGDGDKKLEKEKVLLMGTSGIKGIGKTEFLLQLPQHVKQLGEKLNKSLGCLFLSFSGYGGPNAGYYRDLTLSLNNAPESALSKILRTHCGGHKDPTKAGYQTLPSTVDAIRGKHDSLVILVDEVGELGDQGATEVMHALMSTVDAMGGKLVCVFCHIRQEVLTNNANESGRRVKTIALPSLPVDIWQSKSIHDRYTPEELKKLAASSPELHQFLLSLSGHPRSLFEAFPQLETGFWRNTASLVEARKTVREVCKWNSTTDDQLSSFIPRWLAGGADLRKTELISHGLLHAVNGHDDLCFLSPLLVKGWAQRNAKESALAFHLQEIYDSDALLNLGSEKQMEGVMMHYEAALRLSIGAKKQFSLKDYYGVVPKHSSLANGLFEFAVGPQKSSHVASVESFDENNMDEVLECLKLGMIVYSKKYTEQGVEYLTPFLRVRGKKRELMIACVQCKFVGKKVNWSKADEEMAAAMKYFKTNKVDCFPVYFTSVDQNKTTTKHLNSSICTLEEDLFKLTSKLGILRVHCVKLGKQMKNKYPFLISGTIAKPVGGSRKTRDSSAKGTTSRGKRGRE